MLHAPSPQLSPDGSGGPAPATRSGFHANPGLLLAELALLTQGALAIATGVNVIRGATSLALLGSGVNMTPSSDVAGHFGFGIIVIAVAVIALTGAVNLPSQWVRALLTVLEVVGLGAALAAHFGGGTVLGFVTVLAMGASGSALVPFGVVIGIQAVAIYFIAIHPATYRAFSRS